MWYLGYVQGGYTTKAEGNGVRLMRQIYVARELESLGIDYYLPLEMRFERKGKSRRPEAVVRPYLQNYIFINTPSERFLDVLGVKYLTPTLKALRRDDVAALRAFRALVDVEYARQERTAANQEAISEYAPGQALEFIDGQFQGQLLKFKRLIERAHDLHPKVQMEAQMMGQAVTVEADPLEIRAAE